MWTESFKKPFQGRRERQTIEGTVSTMLSPRTHFMPRNFFLLFFLLWFCFEKSSWNVAHAELKLEVLLPQLSKYCTLSQMCASYLLTFTDCYTLESCGVQCLNLVVFLFKNLYIFILFVWLCLWRGDYGSQKVCQIPEAGGLQKLVSFSVWVLRAELGSSGGAASNNRWIISLVSNFVGFLESKNQNVRFFSISKLV